MPNFFPMSEETEYTYKEALNKLMDCIYMSNLIGAKLIKALEDNGKDAEELKKVFTTEDKEFTTELFRIFKHFLFTKYGDPQAKRALDDPTNPDLKKSKT